jgi:hypothetical protein
MRQRLIPRSDDAFRTRVCGFAAEASKNPERFSMSQEDADALLAAATRFELALRKSQLKATRSFAATREKNEARVEAERLFKRAIERFRASGSEDVGAKMAAGLREPSGKRRPRTVPQEPPRMRFRRAMHTSAGSLPMHELTFCALDQFGSGSKPAGATRLELFVDLIGPDEPIPTYPGANYGGRPWYLRSFSRSPLRVTPPTSRVPMLVVYWGRWADATGNVGPWSATVVSCVEGHSQHIWLGATNRLKNAPAIIEDTSREGRAEKYSVAVRDAQYEYLNQADVAPPPLPAPEGETPGTPQLEGPRAKEAA